MSDILMTNQLWLQAAKLSEYAYGLLDEFPEEERWGMQSNLRKHAFNVTNDIAEGIAGDDPRNAYHSFNYALRDLYGLKNSLTMAKRAKLISVDPEMMLTIEELAKDITTAQKAAQLNIQEFLNQFDAEEKDTVSPKGGIA